MFSNEIWPIAKFYSKSIVADTMLPTSLVNTIVYTLRSWLRAINSGKYLWRVSASMKLFIKVLRDRIHRLIQWSTKQNIYIRPETDRLTLCRQEEYKFFLDEIAEWNGSNCSVSWNNWVESVTEFSGLWQLQVNLLSSLFITLPMVNTNIRFTVRIWWLTNWLWSGLPRLPDLSWKRVSSCCSTI